MRWFSFSYWINWALERHAPVTFILGGPGSGKGSMCELLSKDFDFVHISAGELLRKEVASKSDLSQEI